MRVGGPYVISVESAAGNSYLDSIFLELGETERLALTVGVQVEEEVVVVGQKLKDTGLVTGPKSTLTSDDINNIASVKRDIKDAVATQPFVNVYSISFNGDDTESISIAGQNARYSTFSVDGIGQSDDFGLEYGGYPGVRSPISQRS